MVDVGWCFPENVPLNRFRGCTDFVVNCIFLQLSGKGIQCHSRKTDSLWKLRTLWLMAMDVENVGRELMRKNNHHRQSYLTWLNLDYGIFRVTRIDLVLAPNGVGGGSVLLSKPTSVAHCSAHLEDIWNSSGTGCFWNCHGNILFLKTVLNNH